MEASTFIAHPADSVRTLSGASSYPGVAHHHTSSLHYHTAGSSGGGGGGGGSGDGGVGGHQQHQQHQQHQHQHQHQQHQVVHHGHLQVPQAQQHHHNLNHFHNHNNNSISTAATSTAATTTHHHYHHHHHPQDHPPHAHQNNFEPQLQLTDEELARCAAGARAIPLFQTPQSPVGAFDDYINSPLLSHNLDYSFGLDSALQPWLEQQLPPSFTMNHHHVGSASSFANHSPTNYRFPRQGLHNSNCSSCCDKDDCCTAVCPNKNCTSGCSECNIPDTCSVPFNCNLTKCPDVVCSSTPCSSATVCQMSPATDMCAEDTCPEAVHCDDEGCEEGCEDPCCDPCESTGCVDICEQDSCGVPQKNAPCFDYSFCGNGFEASSFPKQQNVSYHVHAANATRYPQGQPQLYSASFTNMSPNKLQIENPFQPRDQFMFRNFTEPSSCPVQMPTPRITPQPSSKRRKMSAQGEYSSASPETTPGYETAPSSVDHTPVGGDLCMWDMSCDFHFGDDMSLQNHLQQSHKRALEEAVCLWDGCGQQATDPQSLMNHIQTAHTHHSQPQQQQQQQQQRNNPIFLQTPGTPTHVCQWAGCNSVFYSIRDLQAHLNVHVEVENQRQGFMCEWDNCSLEVPTPLDVVKHVQAEHLRRSSAVSVASVASVGSLPGSFSQMQTTPRPTIMPISPKSPESPKDDSAKICEWQDVDGHGRVHVCGLEFDTPAALQEHAKKEHITELKKKTGYFCRWASCTRKDKPFSQKGKVERHLQTHTGYKSCTCEICGKEFSAPQALQQHIRTHTGEKPYKCDICGKVFAQGSAMTMHKRVHTGERPLKCDFPGCDKRFSESSNLSKHRKTHNPVGKHVCGIDGCVRSFHRLDQMKRHQKTHNPPQVLAASIP